MTGKIKYIAILLISISVLVSVCDAHGVRKDKETLIADARDIIYGKVESIEYVQYEGYPHWMTKVTLRVIDQFKGEKVEEVVVQYQGGEFFFIGFSPGTIKQDDEAIVLTFKTELGYLTILEAWRGYSLVKDGLIERYEMTLEQFRDYVTGVMASDLAREISQREMDKRQRAVYEARDIVSAKVERHGVAKKFRGSLSTPITLRVLERFKGDHEEHELEVLLPNRMLNDYTAPGLHFCEIGSEVIVYTALYEDSLLIRKTRPLLVIDGLIWVWDMTLSQFRDFVKRELSRDWAIEYAEDIVYGKVTKRRTGKSESGGTLTYVHLKVLERYKGNSRRRKIVLAFPGKSEERYPYLKPFQIGAELIVYARMLPWGYPGTFQDSYRVVDGTIPELNMSLAEYREFVKVELAKCLNE